MSNVHSKMSRTRDGKKEEVKDAVRVGPLKVWRMAGGLYILNCIGADSTSSFSPAPMGDGRSEGQKCLCKQQHLNMCHFVGSRHV